MPANKKYVPTNRPAPGKFYKSPEERAAVRAVRVAEQEAIQAEKEAVATAILERAEGHRLALIAKEEADREARARAKAKIAADKKAAEEKIIADKKAAHRKIMAEMKRIKAEKETAQKAARKTYLKTPRGLLESITKGTAGVSLIQNTLIFDETFIGSEFYFSPFKDDKISVPTDRPAKINIAHLV